jgi:YD repeat-containing protein
VGTDVPVAASVALRYHYDAYGRVVGRTLDPDGTPVSQYFIYDNDRIVQELDGSNKERPHDQEGY